MDPLQALLQSGAVPATSFPPESRYHGVETAKIETNEEPIVYLRRRFVPPPENFADWLEHTVTDGERLDHIAARFLGDATQFWRLCDANGVLRPEELIEQPGRTLRITLPEGMG